MKKTEFFTSIISLCFQVWVKMREKGTIVCISILFILDWTLFCDIWQATF